MAAALSTLLLLGGCSSKSSRISAGTAAVETTTDSLPESAQTLDTRQAASLAETVSLHRKTGGATYRRNFTDSGKRRTARIHIFWIFPVLKIMALMARG